MLFSKRNGDFYQKALGISAIFLLIIQVLAFSQETKKPAEMDAGYYVVVGAYSPSMEHYAKKYMQTISKLGKEANYGYSSQKNLLFVYLDYSPNYRASINKMLSTRETEQFSDAWVFVCSGGGDTAMTKEEKERSRKTTEAMKEQVDQLDNLYAEKFEGEEKEEKSDAKGEQAAEDKEAATAEDNIVDKEVADEKGTEEENKEKALTGTLQDYKVYFKLENARNSKEIDGEVQVIDAERAKLLKVIEGGEYVEIPDPENGTGKLTLICDIFGYRKSQKNINYYHPFADTASSEVSMMADVYLVNFELVRYHVGDIVTMYNVYYFNDAALMRPESKYEINSLLEMMNENPNYKIRIHGHTNGKRPGKIIKKGDADSFFALSEENKEVFGSSKELSKERAEIIKNYLVEQGIPEERMEIKAWGGKRMLYNKFSSQAKHNVRVEIEILEE